MDMAAGAASEHMEDLLDADMLIELLEPEDTAAVAAELDAAARLVEADAQASAAGAPLHCEAAAAACGCHLFAAALKRTGMLEELPSLSASPDPASVRLTVFGPSDAAFAALPPSAWHDAAELRSLLRLHICVGELPDPRPSGGGDMLSLIGHSHRLSRRTDGVGLIGIGNAGVAAAPFAFRCGTLYPIDSVLWGLELVTPCRREQVWRKAIQPPPLLRVLGAPPASALLQCRVALLHRSTGDVVPDALRGGVKPIGGVATGVANGVGIAEALGFAPHWRSPKNGGWSFPAGSGADALFGCSGAGAAADPTAAGFSFWSGQPTAVPLGPGAADFSFWPAPPAAPAASLAWDAAIPSEGAEEGLLVEFADLVIETKPSALNRKRPSSIAGQAAACNAYVLAFSLFSAAEGRHFGGAASSLPIELKNSFHTLSEGEKALRRMKNPPRWKHADLKPKIAAAAGPAPVAWPGDASVAVRGGGRSSISHRVGAGMVEESGELRAGIGQGSVELAVSPAGALSAAGADAATSSALPRPPGSMPVGGGGDCCAGRDEQADGFCSAAALDEWAALAVQGGVRCEASGERRRFESLAAGGAYLRSESGGGSSGGSVVGSSGDQGGFSGSDASSRCADDSNHAVDGCGGYTGAREHASPAAGDSSSHPFCHAPADYFSHSSSRGSSPVLWPGGPTPSWPHGIQDSRCPAASLSDVPEMAISELAISETAAPETAAPEIAISQARRAGAGLASPSDKALGGRPTASISGGGLWSSAARPPQLLDMSVTCGPAEGGTMVWVEGAGLDAPGLSIYFGARRADVVAVCSSQLLKCRTPPCEIPQGGGKRVVRVRLVLPRCGASSSPQRRPAQPRGGSCEAPHLPLGPVAPAGCPDLAASLSIHSAGEGEAEVGLGDGGEEGAEVGVGDWADDEAGLVGLHFTYFGAPQGGLIHALPVGRERESGATEESGRGGCFLWDDERRLKRRLVLMMRGEGGMTEGWAAQGDVAEGGVDVSGEECERPGCEDCAEVTGAPPPGAEPAAWPACNSHGSASPHRRRAPPPPRPCSLHQPAPSDGVGVAHLLAVLGHTRLLALHLLHPHARFLSRDVQSNATPLQWAISRRGVPLAAALLRRAEARLVPDWESVWRSHEAPPCVGHAGQHCAAAPARATSHEEAALLHGGNAALVPAIHNEEKGVGVSELALVVGMFEPALVVGAPEPALSTAELARPSVTMSPPAAPVTALILAPPLTPAAPSAAPPAAPGQSGTTPASPLLPASICAPSSHGLPTTVSTPATAALAVPISDEALRLELLARHNIRKAAVVRTVALNLLHASGAMPAARPKDASRSAPGASVGGGGLAKGADIEADGPFTCLSPADAGMACDLVCGLRTRRGAAGGGHNSVEEVKNVSGGVFAPDSMAEAVQSTDPVAPLGGTRIRQAPASAADSPPAAASEVLDACAPRGGEEAGVARAARGVDRRAMRKARLMEAMARLHV